MSEGLEIARATLGLAVIVGGIVVSIVALSRFLRVPKSPPLVVFVVLSAIGLVFVATVGANVFDVTDAIVYDSDASAIAELLRTGGRFPTMMTGHAVWPFVLGVVYFVFGDHQLLGLVLNAGIVGLAVVFISRTAVEFSGVVSGGLTVASILLMPVALLYGPSLLRESLSWLGMALLGCGAAMMVARRLDGPTIFAAGTLVSIAVRPNLGFWVAVAALGAVFGIRLLTKRRYISLGALAVGYALGTYFFGPTIVTVLSFSPEFVGDNRDYLAAATTGFVTPETPLSGSLGLVAIGLLTLPRALLGPLPTEIGTEPVWLWVIANSLYWFVLLVLVVVRFRGRPDVGAVLLMMTSVALLGIAITLTNYGIVVRMRGMLIFLLLPLVLAPIRTPQLRPVSGETWDLTRGASAKR